MQISATARQRLLHLRRQAGAACIGFRCRGFIGTCRGSTPILEPIEQASPDEQCQNEGDFILLFPAEHQATAALANLDYEGGLLGRGLYVTWPHHDNCHCHER